MIEKNISWKYYGDQWNNYVPDPYQLNYGAIGKNTDEYCTICNPFQYDTSIMANAAVRTLTSRTRENLYSDMQDGTSARGVVRKAQRPGRRSPGIFQAGSFRRLQQEDRGCSEEANPTLWKDTAIFITFDEGGGYYDSGYVQPLDFFGDGTRIPLIVVSPYTKGGHISHEYSDHVSILKFIERNWGLETVTRRSRDNFPNPITTQGNPYVPVNSPAIGDLFSLFNFDNN